VGLKASAGGQSEADAAAGADAEAGAHRLGEGDLALGGDGGLDDGGGGDLRGTRVVCLTFYADLPYLGWNGCRRFWRFAV